MPLPTSRELREMLDEATPAPWRAVEASICERCAHVRASATLVRSADMADASLIALAPQLAEEVIRLREEIDRLKWYCLDGCRAAEAEEARTDGEAKAREQGKQAAFYGTYLQITQEQHKENP